MGLIYCIIFPNGKRYIGQTTRKLNERKNEHLYNARNNNSNILYSAINKYGEANLMWEILELNIKEELLNEREQYWINYYNTFFLNGEGYNMTYGGQNYRNRCIFNPDSEVSYMIYEEYKECGSTTKIAKKYNCSVNVINNLLRKIDPQWKKYSKIGRGHVNMFSKDECLQIYERYKTLGQINVVANEYNVSRSTITSILKNIDVNYKQFKSLSNFTKEEELQIYQDYLLNSNIKQISIKYNSSWETISNIIKRYQ